ncbi:hypothetical protein [Oceanotoga teriensis]|jgi:hypothetical protein|uniref:hypothetical protein n=1 Tax=Oceanotoga teriensis TaxID=515440 RepID=UPI002713CEC2|nr:hypothetical protein [Oceanotoga teriensis]MDO7976922.1 hypothetical protein [Oceanotoga teriensis]
MAKIALDPIEEKKEETPKKIKINKKFSPGSIILEMFLGTFNIIFSIAILSFSIILNLLKSTIHQIIGSQFTLDMRPLIFITIPIFLFGVFLHFYSIERIAKRYYKLYGLLIFFNGIFMSGIILFYIYKMSINWFGVSIFGNTSIGLNQWFYLPSILYIIYSIFTIYYSLILMRK